MALQVWTGADGDDQRRGPDDRFPRGSREAFEELFARYRDRLYGFFLRRLGQSGRAEDLMQETFLAVIRAKTRYTQRALVRTYLFGIALNLLAAERRRQARDTSTDGPEPAADEHHVETLWLRQALEKLDPGEGEILMLREYERLSYSEIAAVLRLPVNTVRSRLFRARMALKHLLRPVEA